jgi:hypothetical protein
MHLDEYKTTCSEVLDGLPLELCTGQDVFTPGAWSEADRLTLLRLNTLYIIACDLDFDTSEPFFDYWWTLPVRYELKQAVLNNARAF